MYDKGEIYGKHLILDVVKNTAPKKLLVECIECGIIKENWYTSIGNCKYCIPRKRQVIDKGDYFELELTGGEFTKIDKDDYEKIRNNCWYKTKRGSVESRFKDGLVKLHRFILKPPKDKVVDHINGDTLDNRKSNLRICNILENSLNRKASKSNKIGIKNIYFYPRKGLYLVQIKKGGQYYYSKYFKGLEEAIIARDKYLPKIHGEFARI